MMSRPVLSLLFVLSSIALSAQEWLRMIEEPDMNFYQALDSFVAWREPLLRELDERGAALDDLERVTLKNTTRRFKSWARAYTNAIDALGNPLSPAQVKRREQDFHGPARQKSAQQGGWHSYGPGALDSLSGLGVICAIASSPAQPDRIYVGSWFSGIWRSDDSGDSWEPVLDSLARYTTRALAVHPTNSDVVYAALQPGLLRSMDAGATWELLDLGGFPVADGSAKILVDPSQPQRILVGGGAGLIRSEDGGDTWSAVFTGALRDLELKPDDPLTMFAYANISLPDSDAVLRSTDGGLTFDTIASFTGNNPNGISGIAVSQADPERLYVFLPGAAIFSGPPGQVARSLDGGDSFELMPFSPLLRGFYYPNVVAASDTDPDVLLAGDIYLRRSDDGGNTWTAPHVGEPDEPAYMHIDHRDVAFLNGAAWSCNDGGIYSSSDGGATWTDRTGSMAIGHVTDHDRWLGDTTTIAMGQSHNGCHYIHNGPWRKYCPNDGYNVAIDPDDPLHAFGTDEDGHTIHTFDGGLSYVPGTGITESGWGFRPDKPWVFNPQRPHTVYALRDNVFRSFNRGVTWSALTDFPSNTGSGILIVHPADSNVMYTGYWRSTDNGVNWSPMEDPEGSTWPFGAMAVDQDDPARVWACSLGNILKVYYSADTGATWTPVPSFDLPFSTSRSLVHIDNGHDALYLVTDVGVFFRDDQVSNWQPFSGNLPFCTLYDLLFHPMDNKLSLSVFGRGIWMADLFDHTQPPVADLLVEDTVICPGQTVTFHDNSLNNGPGYDPVYAWSFPGGVPSTSTDPDPVVTYPNAGVYGASLSITNANGADAITYGSLITVEQPIAQLPLNEGFEGEEFPPQGWSDIDPNGVNSWDHMQYDGYVFGGYAASQSSARYGTAAPGPVLDALLTPTFLFDAPQGWALMYDRAYRCHTDTARWDSLRVFYTTDCDMSRQALFTIGCDDLGTDPPSIYWLSPDSSTWATDTVMIGTIPALQPVAFGFEFPSGGQQWFYLDNVRLEYLQPMNVAEVLGNGLTLTPNPATDQLRIRARQIMHGALVVLDADGRMVMRQRVSGDQADLDLRGLGNGLYLVRLEGKSEMARFVVAR